MEERYMKCLIINGSPRKGYTWKLVENIKEKMQQEGNVEFEEIMLIEKNIPMCRGCFSCFTYGEDKCPHYESINPIATKITEADCLILTSPVYALNISGLLKNFIDHTAYFYHRPRFFEKKALVVSSTAGGFAKQNCKYMKDTLKHWGFNKVYLLSVIRKGEEELTEKVKAKCSTVAQEFYRDVKSTKLYSPSLKRIFFYNLWRRLSVLSTALEADHNYWQESKLVDSVYAPNIPMGIIKRAFGNMSYALCTKIMK